MAIAKKAANEKHFKKDQPVTSGQRLYDYVQTKQTANKPQKSGKNTPKPAVRQEDRFTRDAQSASCSLWLY